MSLNAKEASSLHNYTWNILSETIKADYYKQTLMKMVSGLLEEDFVVSISLTIKIVQRSALEKSFNIFFKDLNMFTLKMFVGSLFSKNPFNLSVQLSPIVWFWIFTTLE